MSDIYSYDVLRSDKTISGNGLEARTPFLDRNFVQFYLSLPASFRFHVKHDQCEKYLLRKSFQGRGVIPDSVLWRNKEAFSDGVSGAKKSWYEIIDEKIKSKFGTKYEYLTYNTVTHNRPMTREQRYYREIYDKLYPNTSSIIPYFWMPKFIDADDCSARTLQIYKDKNNSVTNNVLNLSDTDSVKASESGEASEASEVSECC